MSNHSSIKRPMHFMAIWLIASAMVYAACGSGDNSDVLAPGATNCSDADAKKCAVLCDPNLGCVDCRTNSDCGAAEPFCVQGECRECSSSADCSAAQSCHPKDHECRSKCNADSDCNEDNEPLCDPATAACVGCRNASDCPAAKPLCSPVTRQCVACTSNNDCGASAPICDIEDGNCRECLVDSQCSAGQVCSDEECQAGCQSNQDCSGDNTICKVESQRCVECVANSDCPATASLCINDRCIQCQMASDCSDPELNACKDGECVECTEDQHCPDGLQCKGQECRD